MLFLVKVFRNPAILIVIPHVALIQLLELLLISFVERSVGVELIQIN